MLTTFITIATIHLLAVISPGPDFAIVTKNSIIHSRKIGIYTAIGIAVGILVHVAYSLLGIGFIIAQSIVLFNIIKFAGAGYLIYIGYKSLRSKPTATEIQTEHATPAKTITAREAFKTGFLTNALNPKATLFFLALFTQVVDPATSKVIQLAYGIEMMCMTAIWFSIVAIFFSNGLIRKKVARIQYRVEQVTGAVLIALGIKVALSKR